MGKWQALRNITRKRRREPSETSSEASEKQQGKHDVKTQIHHVPSTTVPFKKPPPRLELPIDVWSSPFSKATYSPPSSPEIPRLRRMKAIEDLSLPAFRLMELPTELRLHILGLYFGQKVIAVSFRRDKPDQKRFFCKAHQQRRLNVVSVLQSCRRLSREAYAVLWSTTTFFIRIGDYFPLRRLPRPAIPLSQMRHIVLRIGFIEAHQASDFRKLLLSFENLKTADVHFDLTGTRSSNSRREWTIAEVGEALRAEIFGRVSCVSSQFSEDDVWSLNVTRSLVPYEGRAFKEFKAKINA